MIQTPYIQFDGSGKFVGSGIAFTPGTPAQVEGGPAPVPFPPVFPPGAVECTSDQSAAAGPWTTLVSGAIVIGSPAAPEPVIVYVPNWLVRQRLQSANLWDQTVAAMSAAQQIEFSTLQIGIDPSDPTVIALLAAIGADHTAILAPV